MSKRKQIHTLVSCIDLTSLNEEDTENSILSLIQNANEGIDLHYPAAICAFSKFANFIRSETKLPIAAVAGDFPSGRASTEQKLNELKSMIDLPINEFDVVINHQDVVDGNFEKVHFEISESKKLVKNRILKVIIESGELSEEQIVGACRAVLLGGANFIKTSTGKTSVGATPNAARIICQEIKGWYDAYGDPVGFKASGGIKTFEDAMVYANIVEQELGKEWLRADRFRIGASSLYNQLREELKNS